MTGWQRLRVLAGPGLGSISAAAEESARYPCTGAPQVGVGHAARARYATFRRTMPVHLVLLRRDLFRFENLYYPAADAVRLALSGVGCGRSIATI